MDSDRKDIHNSDVPILCASCEARHKGICGALNPQELVTLAKTTRKSRHETGHELIGESEEKSTYSNIMRGVVKLTKTMQDGRQQVVGLQFAPDFLGRPFSAISEVNADAATEVDTCSFPKTVLDRLIVENPELEHRLLQQALRELDDARDWMLTLGRKTAAEKVASYLLHIARHIDPTMSETSTSSRFQLPMNRWEIADYLGLTIETVSRQITKLRKVGVIVVTNNRDCEIPDLEKLRDRAG